MTWLLLHAGEAGASQRRLPPLHPILVNFTAALVPISLLSDVLGRFLRRESLTSTGWWTLLFAAVATPFTALAGWMWLSAMDGMDMRQMTVHKWLGTTLAVGLVVLVTWRGLLHRRSKAPGPAYLLVAVVVVAALVYQGELGGTMSFGGAAESSSNDNHGASASTPAESTTAQPQHEQHDQHTGRPLQEGWHDHIDVP